MINTTPPASEIEHLNLGVLSDFLELLINFDNLTSSYYNIKLIQRIYLQINSKYSKILTNCYLTVAQLSLKSNLVSKHGFFSLSAIVFNIQPLRSSFPYTASEASVTNLTYISTLCVLQG